MVFPKDDWILLFCLIAPLPRFFTYPRCILTRHDTTCPAPAHRWIIPDFRVHRASSAPGPGVTPCIRAVSCRVHPKYQEYERRTSCHHHQHSTKPAGPSLGSFAAEPAAPTRNRHWFPTPCEVVPNDIRTRKPKKKYGQETEYSTGKQDQHSSSRPRLDVAICQKKKKKSVLLGIFFCPCCRRAGKRKASRPLASASDKLERDAYHPWLF